MSERCELEVAKLIEAFGPAEVLRAITRVARRKYETWGEKFFQRTPEQLEAEPPREERREQRREHDIATAWLCLDLTYAAGQFEKAIEQAGLSRQEQCELRRQKEIETLKERLARAEAATCTDISRSSL